MNSQLIIYQNSQKLLSSRALYTANKVLHDPPLNWMNSYWMFWTAPFCVRCPEEPFLRFFSIVVTGWVWIRPWIVQMVFNQLEIEMLLTCLTYVMQRRCGFHFNVHVPVSDVGFCYKLVSNAMLVEEKLILTRYVFCFLTSSWMQRNSMRLMNSAWHSSCRDGIFI